MATILLLPSIFLEQTEAILILFPQAAQDILRPMFMASQWEQPQETLHLLMILDILEQMAILHIGPAIKQLFLLPHKFYLTTTALA